MRKLIWSAMTMLLLCNVVTGQNHMTNKGNKPDTITYFGKLGEVVVAGWDAIFEKDRPKVVQNAFNIGVDTVYETRKQHRENLLTSMKNRDIPKSVDSPVPIFEEKKITVKMVNGSFVKVEQETPDSTSQVAKGLLKESFGVNTDDIDLDFFKSNTFVYEGEVYKRVPLEEFETEEYKKPRIKKPKTHSVASSAPFTHSYTPTSNEDFVNEYDDAALDGERHGVPYAITMAQGILESRGGRSRMAVQLNNLFGIKCNGGRCNKQGCGHGYYTDDRKDETFERHASYEASFKRHIQFFLNNDRYAKCLSCGANDVECWLYRLGRSGYATDRMYDYKLAEIINRYKLTPRPIRYDRKKYQ